MKYNNKCPICKRKATKKIGKVKFCDDCYKKVHRYKTKVVYSDYLVYTVSPTCSIHGWIPIKVY